MTAVNNQLRAVIEIELSHPMLAVIRTCERGEQPASKSFRFELEHDGTEGFKERIHEFLKTIRIGPSSEYVLKEPADPEAWQNEFRSASMMTNAALGSLMTGFLMTVIGEDVIVNNGAGKFSIKFEGNLRIANVKLPSSMIRVRIGAVPYFKGMVIRRTSLDGSYVNHKTYNLEFEHQNALDVRWRIRDILEELSVVPDDDVKLDFNGDVEQEIRYYKEAMSKSNSGIKELIHAFWTGGIGVNCAITGECGRFSLEFEDIPPKTAKIVIMSRGGLQFGERGSDTVYDGTLNKVLQQEPDMTIQETIIQYLDNVLTIICAYKTDIDADEHHQVLGIQKANKRVCEHFTTRPDASSYRYDDRNCSIRIEIGEHKEPSSVPDGRITKEYIESQIERVDYFTAADAVPEIPNGEYILYCVITMKNKHQETANAIAGNESTFDPERGKAAAYSKAIGQLFPKYYFVQMQDKM